MTAQVFSNVRDTTVLSRKRASARGLRLRPAGEQSFSVPTNRSCQLPLIFETEAELRRKPSLESERYLQKVGIMIIFAPFAMSSRKASGKARSQPKMLVSIALIPGAGENHKSACRRGLAALRRLHGRRGCSTSGGAVQDAYLTLQFREWRYPDLERRLGYHKFFFSYRPKISPWLSMKYATLINLSSSASASECFSTIVPGTMQMLHSLARAWYLSRYTFH